MENVFSTSDDVVQARALRAKARHLNSPALRDGLSSLPRSPDAANVRQTETSLPWDSVVDDTKVRIQHAIEGLKHVLTNLKDPFDQELFQDTLDTISRTPDRPSPPRPGKDQTRSPSRASVLQARLRWADTVPEARTGEETSDELVDSSRAILRVAVDKMAMPVFESDIESSKWRSKWLESDIESSKWRANAQKSAKLAEELQALLVEATKDRDEKERRNGMLQADLIAKIAEVREKEEDRAGWQLERARLLADLQAEQERHASRAPQLQSLAVLLASKEQELKAFEEELALRNKELGSYKNQTSMWAEAGSQLKLLVGERDEQIDALERDMSHLQQQMKEAVKAEHARDDKAEEHAFLAAARESELRDRLGKVEEMYRQAQEALKESLDEHQQRELQLLDHQQAQAQKEHLQQLRKDARIHRPDVQVYHIPDVEEFDIPNIEEQVQKKQKKQESAILSRRLTAECEKLKEQLCAANEEISQLITDLSESGGEIRSLREELQQRSEELEQWRRAYSNMQPSYSNMQASEAQQAHAHLACNNAEEQQLPKQPALSTARNSIENSEGTRQAHADGDADAAAASATDGLQLVAARETARERAELQLERRQEREQERVRRRATASGARRATDMPSEPTAEVLASIKAANLELESVQAERIAELQKALAAALKHNEGLHQVVHSSARSLYFDMCSKAPWWSPARKRHGVCWQQPASLAASSSAAFAAQARAAPLNEPLEETDEESVEAIFVSSEAKSLTPHVAKPNGEGQVPGQAQPRKAAVEREISVARIEPLSRKKVLCRQWLRTQQVTTAEQHVAALTRQRLLLLQALRKAEEDATRSHLLNDELESLIFLPFEWPQTVPRGGMVVRPSECFQVSSNMSRIIASKINVKWDRRSRHLNLRFGAGLRF